METIVNTTENHTLYAHWAPKVLKVTFNAMGGTASKDTKDVKYNNVYGKLPTATKDGYTLDGWYTAASGGQKITEDTIITTTSNITLYAHWSANK